MRQMEDHVHFMKLLFSVTNPYRWALQSSFNDVTFWDTCEVTKASFGNSFRRMDWSVRINNRIQFSRFLPFMVNRFEPPVI